MKRCSNLTTNQRILRLSGLFAVICLVSVVCGPAHAQDYQLGPDDVLEISVYREPELNRTVRVSSNGYISLPMMGKIMAVGLTVSDLENRISEEYKQYIKNPQVSVYIVEYATITVIGQVEKPGSYPLKGELSVLQAIGLAEGFTGIAAQNDVKVMRMKNGVKRTIDIKVADINAEGDKTRDVWLERGDIVFVPESTVTVTGQVKNPGSYPLKSGLTVIDVLGMAGGFTKFASRNKVKVMRIENGEKKTITVKVADINRRGDKTIDVTLRRNDTIFVPESLF